MNRSSGDDGVSTMCPEFALNFSGPRTFGVLTHQSLYLSINLLLLSGLDFCLLLSCSAPVRRTLIAIILATFTAITTIMVRLTASHHLDFRLVKYCVEEQGEKVLTHDRTPPMRPY